MNDIFVPYEIASLALLHKYDGKVFGIIYQDGFIGMGSPDFAEIMLRKDSSAIKAPMYDQLVNWFWEKHHMYIVPRLATGSQPLWWDWVISSSSTKLEAWADDEESYETKQEALTAAFKYAFKLLP